MNFRCSTQTIMLFFLALVAGSLMTSAVTPQTTTTVTTTTTTTTTTTHHAAIVDAVADLCLDGDVTGASACAMLQLVSSCPVEPSAPEKEGPSGNLARVRDGRTIFVPADTAFSAVELDFLKQERDVACAIVKYHTVQGVHLAFGERNVELTSTYVGAPLFVNNFQKTSYLNMHSYVSGSKVAPPRILSSRLAGDVVVHLIDAVATPFITKKDYDNLAAKGANTKNFYIGGLGLSLNPFQPGAQTGVINAGPGFYTRNAFGQAYNPFTAIWLNLYTGYDSNPALYCQTIRCKDPINAGRFAPVETEIVVVDEPEPVVAVPAPEPEAEIAPNSIAGTAIATDVLSSLVAAVLAVPGLVDLLVNPEDTFTVLAPTNDAFAALLATLGVDSVDDIPTEVLTQVLSYHLIPGDAVKVFELFDGASFTTAEGDDVTVSIEDDGTIDFVGIGSTAAVVLQDVVAGNSVVHVIDTVLLPFELPSAPEPEPEPELSIADVAIDTPDLSILVEALVAADFVASLSEPAAALTVFAPINSAFTALLETLGLSSLSDIPLPTLETVLAYHVVNGAFDEEAVPGAELTTLTDLPVSFSEDGSTITAIGSEATVLFSLEVGNSVVYVIDTVLLPIEV